MSIQYRYIKQYNVHTNKILCFIQSTDSPELLLSIIHFNIGGSNYCFRSSKLFFVPFNKNNCSSASYFPRVVSLANFIADHIDYFHVTKYT